MSTSTAWGTVGCHVYNRAVRKKCDVYSTDDTNWYSLYCYVLQPTHTSNKSAAERTKWVRVKRRGADQVVILIILMEAPAPLVLRLFHSPEHVSNLPPEYCPILRGPFRVSELAHVSPRP
jgi:hypothetical protein